MARANPADVRQALTRAFAAGITAVAGEGVTAAWLRGRAPDRPAFVIALGKAAADMARGARTALGDRPVRGLVVTKQGHAARAELDPRRFTVLETSHPVLDETGLDAGRTLVGLVRALPPDAPVLVLISGGASALVEVPAPGVDRATLFRVHAWLPGSGLPIAAANAIRRRLSRIKGGGLARLLAPRPVTGLLLSDVPGDDPAVIGSGPLTTPADDVLPGGLPAWLLAALPPAPETPPATRPAGVHVIARLDDALDAAERSLRESGLAVRRHPSRLDGDVADVADRVAKGVRDAPGTVHLGGGETTLALPPSPGRGGRSQHLALLLALRLAGDRPAVALCAGTDGTDGPTDDAGAVVDHRTVARGRGAGLDAQEALRRADAGSFLAATGDLLTTGPTGTNVADLTMAWRADAPGRSMEA